MKLLVFKDCTLWSVLEPSFWPDPKTICIPVCMMQTKQKAQSLVPSIIVHVKVNNQFLVMYIYLRQSEYTDISTHPIHFSHVHIYIYRHTRAHTVHSRMFAILPLKTSTINSFSMNTVDSYACIAMFVMIGLEHVHVCYIKDTCGIIYALHTAQYTLEFINNAQGLNISPRKLLNHWSWQRKTEIPRFSIKLNVNLVSFYDQNLILAYTTA